jgi:hypothetical protein
MSYKRISPIPVAEGGSGALTLTGVLIGNGTSAFTGNTVTQYDVLVGGASNAISSIAPSSTSGVPLISQGSSSNPAFGTAVVAGGGTGVTSFNANGVVISNTTTTGALASLALTDGQVVIGSSVGAPAAATLTAGANISITNGHNTITIAASSGGETVNYTAVNHAASPYTVLSTDYYIGVDASGGVVSILLPNAPSTGRVVVVKDKTASAATNNITVTTVGGAVNIDGATSFVMNTNYESANFIFNGVSYEVW